MMSHSRISGARLAAAAALFLCSAALPGPAAALMWGPRAGVGIDPDQFVFGAHFRPDAIADNLYLQPNVEVGVGDDVTVLTFNVPLHYYFDTSYSAKPYAGAGFAVGVWSHDDNSDVEFAIDLIGGLEWNLKSGSGFLTEFNLGLGDLHDVELIVGWMF